MVSVLTGKEGSVEVQCLEVLNAFLSQLYVTCSAPEKPMADNLPVSEPNWYISLIQGTTAIPTAIAKLIETVGTQTGLFLEPTHVRRKGQAEADVTVAKAKAEAEIAVLQLENRLVIQDRQDRADERTRRREAKRQKNIEAITAQAAQLLLST